MPTGLPDDLTRSILERDGCRCRECGAAVATVALCFPCHATQGLRRHSELLRRTVPERLPEFVKQMTWDFGLNLLAYSAWIDPRRFEPAQVLEGFAVWQRYLDAIAGLARDAQAGDPNG
jgi:hypothetical protein